MLWWQVYLGLRLFPTLHPLRLLACPCLLQHSALPLAFWARRGETRGTMPLSGFAPSTHYSWTSPPQIAPAQQLPPGLAATNLWVLGLLEASADLRPLVHLRLPAAHLGHPLHPKTFSLYLWPLSSLLASPLEPCSQPGPSFPGSSFSQAC